MNTELKKKNQKESENTLKLARDLRKVAGQFAEYKRTEGYNEDNYSLLDIFNLEASLEVCRRGPADYFYETALDLFSKTLGRNHQETLGLVREIIDYHVNNVRRMMIERSMVMSVWLLFPLMLMSRELFPSVPLRVVALWGCYISLLFYSRIEEWLMCLMERRHYQRVYRNGAADKLAAQNLEV